MDDSESDEATKSYPNTYDIFIAGAFFRTSAVIEEDMTYQCLLEENGVTPAVYGMRGIHTLAEQINRNMDPIAESHESHWDQFVLV
jgi:hypothetical protein